MSDSAVSQCTPLLILLESDNETNWVQWLGDRMNWVQWLGDCMNSMKMDMEERRETSEGKGRAEVTRGGTGWLMWKMKRKKRMTKQKKEDTGSTDKTETKLTARKWMAPTCTCGLTFVVSQLRTPLPLPLSDQRSSLADRSTK